MESVYYSKGFYDQKRKSGIASARIILNELKKLYDFNSVVDIGCGDCIWGTACDELHVNEYIGIDGDYVKSFIPTDLKDRFITHDLESSNPIPVDRTFELVISLEVAEHLHEIHAARFIKSLTSIGKVVMFSAAIPGQGGVNHVNEQWQRYWSQLFRNHGFIPFDVIRPRIWNNLDIADYYKQNIVLYCSQDEPLLLENFKAHVENCEPLLDVVHPLSYQNLRDLSQAPLRDYLLAFPGIIKRVISKRLIIS